MSKYEIRNTTVKPIKRDHTGKDLRPTVDRVGHPVQFRDKQDRVVIVAAGQHTIVNEIDGGLLGLQRGGFIEIKEIKDIATALKAHTLQGSENRSNTKAVKAAAKAETKTKATATQMGLENYEQKGGAEHEEARNPDGDPNFLAKASTSTSGNRRKRAENAAKSGSNEKDGQS